MQFKYQKVDLAKINIADASFRISESDASAELVKSIAAFGVLSPPTLLKKEDRYCVVCGFARIRACQELGLLEIFSRIIEPGTPEKRCVQLAITEKTFQRDLNTVEMAHAIRIIKEVCSGLEDVLDMAQRLGLAVNHKMINKLIAVGQMPDNLKKALTLGAIALPMALQLNSLKDKVVSDQICQLLVELNLSLNRQRELYEWMIAISKREKVGIEQILAEETLQKLRQDPDLDLPQKKFLIRQYFQKRRWPTFTSYENRYNTLVQKLNLKKGVKLVAPANFESGTYTLKIDFKNIDEMKSMEKELARLVRSNHMAQIFEQFKS